MPNRGTKVLRHKLSDAMCRNIRTLFNFDPPATDEEIPVTAPEEGAPSLTIPDDMPNVLLADVSPAQLEAVLVELESSTQAGREVARRVRAGELQLTDTSGPLLHQNLDGAVVTQRRAGGERVAPMEIR